MNKFTPQLETGIIEGFYGKPWSPAGRFAMLEFMSRNGFGTYIYAPKDDPYHRELWRESYPARDTAALTRIIRRCQALKLDFAWAVSPGLSMRYSSRKDFNLLVDKFAWVASFGVNTFAVLLDDIPSFLTHTSDKKKWDSLAAAHSDLLNRFYDAAAPHAGNLRLWFCPQEYVGTSPSPYLETIGNALRPEIGIFWTGPLVVSPLITASDAAAISSVLRRKPLLWDNYPVNDYNRNTLNLAPLTARPAALTQHIDAYFANPMNEPLASMIPLHTIAGWLASPATYHPEKAWRKAVASALPGVTLTTYQADLLREFCQLWPSTFFYGEPPCLAERALATARSGDPAPMARLAMSLTSLESRIKSESSLAPFAREVAPYLRPVRLHAETALAAADLQRKAHDPALTKKLAALIRRTEKSAPRPAAGAFTAYARFVISKYGVSPDAVVNPYL